MTVASVKHNRLVVEGFEDTFSRNVYLRSTLTGTVLMLVLSERSKDLGLEAALQDGKCVYLCQSLRCREPLGVLSPDPHTRCDRGLLRGFSCQRSRHHCHATRRAGLNRSEVALRRPDRLVQRSTASKTSRHCVGKAYKVGCCPGSMMDSKEKLPELAVPGKSTKVWIRLLQIVPQMW